MHLNEDDVVEMLGVRYTQTPHTMRVAPLLEVSVEVPAAQANDCRESRISYALLF